MSELLLEIKDVSRVFRIGGLLFGTDLLALDQINLSLDKSKPIARR
jgi:peptide/nickel transport system ATP-binding protein